MPRKYVTQDIIGSGYTSPLHRFIEKTGRNYGTMTRKEIDNIGQRKDYRQWKRLQRIQRMLKKEELEEANALIANKKSNPFISKSKIRGHIIGLGFSQDPNIETARKPLKGRFGKKPPRVGKRAYSIPKKIKSHITFRKVTFDPTQVGKTKSLYDPKVVKAQYGKGLRKALNAGYEPEEYTSLIESNSKIEKLVSANKILKNKEIIPAKRTATGSPGDSIIINPTGKGNFSKSENL